MNRLIYMIYRHKMLYINTVYACFMVVYGAVMVQSTSITVSMIQWWDSTRTRYSDSTVIVQ